MNNYKLAEKITDDAIKDLLFSSGKRLKPGEAFRRWMKNNPEIDLSELRAKHFNHRIDDL